MTPPEPPEREGHWDKITQTDPYTQGDTARPCNLYNTWRASQEAPRKAQTSPQTLIAAQTDRWLPHMQTPADVPIHTDRSRNPGEDMQTDRYARTHTVDEEKQTHTTHTSMDTSTDTHRDKRTRGSHTVEHRDRRTNLKPADRDRHTQTLPLDRWKHTPCLWRAERWTWGSAEGRV